MFIVNIPAIGQLLAKEYCACRIPVVTLVQRHSCAQAQEGQEKGVWSTEGIRVICSGTTLRQTWSNDQVIFHMLQIDRSRSSMSNDRLARIFPSGWSPRYLNWSWNKQRDLSRRPKHRNLPPSRSLPGNHSLMVWDSRNEDATNRVFLQLAFLKLIRFGRDGIFSLDKASHPGPSDRP